MAPDLVRLVLGETPANDWAEFRHQVLRAQGVLSILFDGIAAAVNRGVAAAFGERE